MSDDNGKSIWTEAFNALTGLLRSNHRELIRQFEIPSPQKVTFNVTADGTGTFGGGFAAPSPIFIWQCPMGQEAWIHRLAITSPQGSPKAPLTTGQAMFVSGAGETLFFLPVGGVVAPLIMAEGYGSAIHLSSGSRLNIYGDSFAANTSLRIDLQISFTRGISQYTPTEHPSDYVSIAEG